MLQLHPAAAELRDQHFRMGREDNDRGAVEKALDPLPRLLPERRVAGADPLVDQSLRTPSFDSPVGCAMTASLDPE
jgi:hypothetical protein